MKLSINPKIGLACILLACQPIQDNTYDTSYVEEVPDPIYAEHVRTSKFQTPEEEMASFELPPGFEVTLFASEPDITKPINMAFDDKGRLWVTQSSEYPIKAGQGEGNDRISILEDTNGDGKADRIIDFADDLNIPIGIIPVKDGAIGYSIPHVYRFYDSDGDGKSEKREILISDFEHKDTHGMVNNLFRGLDGWIHASHGFSNISTVSGYDGDSITMTSGNTFRFRQDGSRVEKTTDGRINPFGSDLDKWGYHYSADCHTLPIYQLIWGGNYTQWGKKDPEEREQRHVGPQKPAGDARRHSRGKLQGRQRCRESPTSSAAQAFGVWGDHGKGRTHGNAARTPRSNTFPCCASSTPEDPHRLRLAEPSREQLRAHKNFSKETRHGSRKRHSTSRPHTTSGRRASTTEGGPEWRAHLSTKRPSDTRFLDILEPREGEHHPRGGTRHSARCGYRQAKGRGFRGPEGPWRGTRGVQ